MSGFIIPFPVATPPDERERWHEMLKISPLIIVLLFFRSRAPAPVTQLELSENLLIDRKTAAKYCRQLSARHFIAQVSERDGYALAEGSASFFEMWGINGHKTLKESLIKDLRLNDKKERKKDVGKFWTHAQSLNAEQIISESGKLFGNQVTVFGLERCDPLMVLSVFAHAYDQRDRLKAPAIFAYRRLQRREKPDKKYLADPESFLPNDFLHALGLQELRVVDVVDVDDVEDAASENVPAPMLADATVTERLDGGKTMSPTLAWQATLRQLKFEMPKANFQFQEEITAVHFENNLLTVTARDAFQQMWLERSLTATVERLLAGILNRKVKVQFMVSTKFNPSVAVETEVFHAGA